MADLGSVARNPVPTLFFRKGASPVTYVQRSPSDPKLVEIDAGGVISGMVLVGGIPRAGVSVGLIYHPNMRLVERTITAADGTYSFVGLNRNELEAYTVLAQDPNAAAPFLRTAAHDHISAG
ncbi:hypothetical protein [Acidovorax sp. RAC01]|uniref:hypothetical protein n=1 Tax=Acidovorax sp. RAC01 TaxID=1842533 RepID=UPI00083E87AD|nr:hypothetical protein [Acidovorax sp. RAC01]AOG22325.1 hypothetical protein BSY15_3717 [Acidovorax sp. RAC01]AOG25391.1 hypothetical protein BSY15_3795 [Acidovorax sp. RAC01]